MWIDRGRGHDPVQPGSRTVELCTLSGGAVVRRLRLVNGWRAEGSELVSELEVLPGSEFAGTRVEIRETLDAPDPLAVCVRVPGASRHFAPSSSLQRIFATEIGYEYLRFFLPGGTPAAPGCGDAVVRRVAMRDGGAEHAYLPPSPHPVFTTWNTPAAATDVQYLGEVDVAGLQMPAQLAALSASGHASALLLCEPAPKAAKSSLLVQRVDVRSDPERVFATFTDPAAHLAATGIACRTGVTPASLVIDEGNIHVRLVHLVAPQLLQFVWQLTTAGIASQLCTLRCDPTGAGGTRVTLLHSGIPVAAGELIRQGWMRYYWDKLGLSRVLIDELTPL